MRSPLSSTDPPPGASSPQINPIAIPTTSPRNLFTTPITSPRAAVGNAAGTPPTTAPSSPPNGITAASLPEVFSPTLAPNRSPSFSSSSLRRMSRESGHSRNCSGSLSGSIPGFLPTTLPSQVAHSAASPPASSVPNLIYPDGVDGHEPGHPWDSAWPGSETAIHAPLSPTVRRRSSSAGSDRSASPRSSRPGTPPPAKLSPSAIPPSRGASRSPELSVRSSRRSPRQQPMDFGSADIRNSGDASGLSAIGQLVHRTSSRRPRSGSNSSGCSSVSSSSSLEGHARLPPAQATAFANLEGPPTYDPELSSSPRQNGPAPASPIHIPQHERAAHRSSSSGSPFGYSGTGLSPGGSSFSPSSLSDNNRLSNSPLMLRSPASPGLSAARIYAASGGSGGGPPATLSSPRLAGMRVSTDAALGVFAGNNSPATFPPGVGGSGSPHFAASPPTAGQSGSPNGDLKSQSPPQKRSFIGMPPRSGYELSDDPDDVGSESDDSASVGSGRGSVGGNTDDEQDASDADGESGGEEEGFGQPHDRERRQQQVLARVRAVMDDEDDESAARLARHTRMSRHHLEGDEQDRDSLEEEDQPSSVEQDYEDLERAYTERSSKRGSRAILQINPALLLNGDDDVTQADAEWSPGEEPAADMPSPPEAIEMDDDNDGMEEDNLSGQFEDDNLSPLERIFMYGKSEMTYHRVLVAQSLYEWIAEVELPDAVEYVIPLMMSLSADELEVCTAFVTNLHLIMWFYFRNCPLVELQRGEIVSNASATSVADVSETEVSVTGAPLQRISSAPASEGQPETARRPRIRVSIFTELLSSLLMNQNPMVAETAQYVLKQFMARLHVGPPGSALAPLRPPLPDEDSDDVGPLLPEYRPGRPSSGQDTPPHLDALDMAVRPATDDADVISTMLNRDGASITAEVYDFGRLARQAIEDEIMQNVVFALGRLHAEAELTTQAEQQGDVAGSWEMPHHGESAPQPTVKGEAADAHSTSASTDADTVSSQDAMDMSPRERFADDDDDVMDVEDDTMEQEQDTKRASGQEELDETPILLDGSSMHDQIMDDANSDHMSDEVDTNTEATVGRMSSVSLLCALVRAKIFSLNTLEMRILPEVVRLRTDSAYFVRKEVALLVGAVAKALGERCSFQPAQSPFTPKSSNDDPESSSIVDRRRSHIEQTLLDTFDLLHNDKIWHVRQGICLSMPSLFAQVQNLDVRRTRVVDSLRSLSTDVSRDVRSTVLEVMGELIYLFHDTPEGPPAELVRYFKGEPFDVDISQVTAADSTEVDESMGVQSSTTIENPFTMDEPWRLDINSAVLSSLERPLVCAFNFPAVVLTLGKIAWPDLRRMHAELAQDSNIKARRSLAASLHELAKIIGPDDTARDLLPLFDMFVLWDDAEVRSAAIEHVDQLLIHASQSDAESKLQLLKESWTGVFARDWRVRERLAELVPALAPKFLLSDEEGNLVALTQLALSDSVASVRTVGARAVPELYATFGQSDPVLADGFLGMISDMADADRYRNRLSFLTALQALLEAHLPTSALEAIFLPRLLRLGKEEKVVDVRINLARVVALLCGNESEYYFDPTSRPEALADLCHTLTRDKSQQVRQVVALALPHDADGDMVSWPEDDDEEDEEEEAKSPRRQLVLGPADGGVHRPSAYDQSDDEHVQGVGMVNNCDQLGAEHLYNLDAFESAQDQDTVHVPLQEGQNQSSSSAYHMWQRPDTEEDLQYSDDIPTTDITAAATPAVATDPDDDWVSTMDVGTTQDTSPPSPT